MSAKLRTHIARAIKKADKSYFFENYDKQAESVLKSLRAEGYRIVKYEPDEELLKEAADTIKTGKMKPDQHIKNVYQTVIGLLEKKS